jgi:hypothetical protein
MVMMMMMTGHMFENLLRAHNQRRTCLTLKCDQ